MADTLTADDLKILQRPFLLDEHEFNKRGFCYVKEAPVTARLEEVDPGWQFEVVGVHRSGAGDQFAVVTARLTLKGVSRSSTGMQAVEYTNASGGGKSDREAGEPEKGATTDALRRCARLFGVGRYILQMGDSVKNDAQLATWLKKHYPTMFGAQPNGQQRASNGNGQQQTGSNGNSSNEPQVHVLTSVKSVKVVHKDDKKWLDAGGVIFWSRQAFKDAGYDTDSWDKPQVVQLKEVPFSVHFTVNPKGFKEGVKVVAE